MIDICAVGPLRMSAGLVNGGVMGEGSRIAIISSQVSRALRYASTTTSLLLLRHLYATTTSPLLRHYYYALRTAPI